MTFEEAIAWMKRGENIKRAHWRSTFIFCKNNKVMMTQGYRKPWHYEFSHMDIFSNDWRIDTSNTDREEWAS